MSAVRSEKTKADFVRYLAAHPQERFWQAVRNFSNYNWVLVTNELPNIELRRMTHDTFYWEEKDK